MNTGPLLPLWLLGAPLVLAIIDLMAMPKSTRSHDTRYVNDAPATARSPSQVR